MRQLLCGRLQSSPAFRCTTLSGPPHTSPMDKAYGVSFFSQGFTQKIHSPLRWANRVALRMLIAILL